jgi:hypothetical protein
MEIKKLQELYDNAYEEYTNDFLEGWTYNNSIEKYTASTLPYLYSTLDSEYVDYDENNKLYTMNPDMFSEDRITYCKEELKEYLADNTVWDYKTIENVVNNISKGEPVELN